MLHELTDTWLDLENYGDAEYTLYCKYDCPNCGEPFNAKVSDTKKKIVQECESCTDECSIKRATAKKMKALKKHEEDRTKRIYNGMKQRCLNPKSKTYARYGGRGITICDEWLNDRDAFISWAMGNGYAKHLSIDRKDNDGNYEPGNCRWTTKDIQAQNSVCLNAKNTSGYRGVSYIKKTGLWYARIHSDGSPVSIGQYSTPLKAALARDAWIRENGTSHTLNF